MALVKSPIAIKKINFWLKKIGLYWRHVKTFARWQITYWDFVYLPCLLGLESEVYLDVDERISTVIVATTITLNHALNTHPFTFSSVTFPSNLISVINEFTYSCMANIWRRCIGGFSDNISSRDLRRESWFLSGLDGTESQERRVWV